MITMTDCLLWIQATKDAEAAVAAAQAAEDARFAAEWKVFVDALTPKADSIIKSILPRHDISNPVCACMIESACARMHACMHACAYMYVCACVCVRVFLRVVLCGVNAHYGKHVLAVMPCAFLKCRYAALTM